MFGFMNRNRLFAPRVNGQIPVVVLRNRKIEVCAFRLPSLLGRNPDEVDMYIFDPSVSRIHLKFELYDGRLIVTDQGSTVGTKINGVALQPSMPFFIEDGANLTVGNVKLKVYINAEMMQQLSMIRPSAQSDYQDEYVENELSDNESENNTRTLFPDSTQSDEILNIDNSVMPPANEQEDGSIEITDFEILAPDLSEESISAEETPEAEDEPESTDTSEPDEVSGSGNESEYDEDVYIEEDRTEILSPKGADISTNVRLRWINTNDNGSEIIAVNWTPFVVGRTENNTDYAIHARGVSHRHFFIDSTNGVYYITDLNSTNGVWINGVRIKPMERHRLQEGDIIGIGEREYIFENA